MRLPRRLSMTRREEFAAVRKGGESLATRNFVMATLPHSHSGILKFGLITSRQAARPSRWRCHWRPSVVRSTGRLQAG